MGTGISSPSAQSDHRDPVRKRRHGSSCRGAAGGEGKGTGVIFHVAPKTPCKGIFVNDSKVTENDTRVFHFPDKLS